MNNIQIYWCFNKKQDRQRSNTKLRPPCEEKNISCWEILLSFLLIFLAVSFFNLLLPLLLLLLLPPSLLFSDSDGPTNIQSNSLKPELKSSYRGLKKLSCLFSFVAPIVNLALSHCYIFCQTYYFVSLYSWFMGGKGLICHLGYFSMWENFAEYTPMLFL